MDNPYKGVKGIPRLINALRNSMEGLAAAVRREEAFRLELIAAVILIPLALYLDFSYIEKAALIGSVLLVLIVELLNTAVEVAIDRISAETHPLSKRAKDLGSAAVLLSLVAAAAVWLLILWGRFGR